MALPESSFTAQLAAPNPAFAPANGGDASAGQGFDVSTFLRNRQIHVQQGSQIDARDPLLVIHRDDARSENEAALRTKIRNAYSMDYPSLFSDGNKAPVMEKLASLVPLDVKTKEEMLVRLNLDISEHKRTGIDPKIARQLEDTAKPFAAVIREYHDTDKDLKTRPEVIAQAKNGVGLYLVLEEALRQRGYTQEPYQLDEKSSSADELLVRMGRHLNVAAPQLKEVAGREGVNGVGRMLGVSEDYLVSVERLTNHLAEHHFSANATQSWKVGGQVQGMQMAGVQERIDAGLRVREQAKVQEVQSNPAALGANSQYVKDSEQVVLAAMKALPPALAESLQRIGTDIVYTPEITVDPIAPGMHAYGFHRRVTHNPDDVQGVQQIFVAGKHDAEEFKRVVVHEAHHLIFPNQFSEPLIQSVDALTKADQERLGKLRDVMKSWNTGDDAARNQAVQRLNSEEFAVNGKTLMQSLGGASLDTFHNMVEHAHERLQINSDTYYKGGYNSPESRFQEINSRYAELRYVRLKDNPEMLNFIVPNTTAIYEQIYMPHVEKQLQALRERDASASRAESSQPSQSVSQNIVNSPVSGQKAHASLSSPAQEASSPAASLASQITAVPACCADGMCVEHQMQALSKTGGQVNTSPTNKVMTQGVSPTPAFSGLEQQVMSHSK